MKKLQYILSALFVCMTQSYGSNQPNEITNATTPQQILESGQNTNQTTATTAEVSKILESAKALKLAESKEWKDLLHIDSSTSEIISPYFFLTPLPHKDKHKSLAESELEATIKAFYQSVESVEIPEAIIKRRQEQIQFFEKNEIKLPVRSIQKQDYHALCRFPARLYFLKQHLDL